MSEGLPRTRGRLGLCRRPGVTCATLKVFGFWVIRSYTRWGCGFHAGFRVLGCDPFALRAYVIRLKPISCAD